MSDTVQKIKEKLSIVDVVTPYVKLTRAGKYWKGLSPFSKEKTPSFFVSPDRGLYHCFSSGKGGDMFTFIEEMENVDFRGSLKILAEKAGVEIVHEAPGARDERERIYDALEASRVFFVENLGRRKDVQEYLTSRGVSEESVALWSLGYADKEWRLLYEYLLKKGFSDSTIEQAGLAKRPDSESQQKGKFYDRFRGRIMFPIRDTSGRVIAFSGRIFEDDPKNPQAKYLNSPETSVFDKSQALYGLDKAKESIRRLNACVLVEGQLDLILSHQIGYRNTVATSGTSFTKTHAEVLKRHSENLLIAYDGDRAGVAAAGRAAAIALQTGLNVKVAKLPPNVDPADLAHKDSAHFKSILKEALHIVDFFLSYLKDANYDTRTYRREVSRTVIPYLAMIPNTIDQAHFVQRVADALGVPEEAVISEVKKVEKQTPSQVAAAPAQAEPFLSRADNLERLVAGLLVLFEERGNKEAAKEARAALLKAVGKEKMETLINVSPNELRPALFEADFFLDQYPDSEKRQAVLLEIYTDLQTEELHAEYRDTVRLLRAAEESHDVEAADKLMSKLSDLAGMLKER